MTSSSGFSSSGRRWEPPSAEELQTALPKYIVTALIGCGGMGAVYRGRQESLDRDVAVKILPPDLSDPSRAERFRNEALAMARLNHPGIVGVFDSGQTADGLLYLVMEFVEGGDVLRLLKENGGKLRLVNALAVTAHVCDALHYAHERGVLHRDIKPANILLTTEGALKVADFGLAKLTQQEGNGLTQSGMGIGTLAYMAPESLILGAGVDRRADVYAVGVMLYQMLTGRLPRGIFKPPSELVPGLDPRLDDIVHKALQEDRELRFATTAEMRRAMDDILTRPVIAKEAPRTVAQTLQAEASVEEPPTPPTKQPFPIWLAVLTVVVLGGLAWLEFFHKRTATEPAASTSGVANPTTPTAPPSKPIAEPKALVAVPKPPVTPPRPSSNSFGISNVAPPPELAGIITKFRDEHEKTVRQPFVNGIIALRASYLSALQAREQSALQQNNSRLQSLLQDEARRLDAGRQLPPADEVGLDAELAELRTTWHREADKLQDTRELAESDLQTRLQEELRKLAETLAPTRKAEANQVSIIANSLDLDDGLVHLLGQQIYSFAALKPTAEPATAAPQMITERLDFTDVKPTPGWRLVTEEKLAWPQIDPRPPGYVYLHSLKGDMIGSNLRAAQLLRSVSGDFEIETQVEFSGGRGNRYEGAGLLLWIDAQNFIRLQRSMNHNRKVPDGMYFAGNIAGKYIRWDNTDDIPTKIVTTDLRLVRQGKTITAFWRAPGQAWQQAGRGVCNWPAKIEAGLIVANTGEVGPVSYRFEHVTVRQAATP